MKLLQEKLKTLREEYLKADPAKRKTLELQASVLKLGIYREERKRREKFEDKVLQDDVEAIFHEQ